MAGMSDSKRRMIMMLTIIFAGSALTFIDLSPVLVLVIAVVMGVVMLFALGMVTFGEIKDGLKAFRHRLSQPVTFGKKKDDKKSVKISEETEKDSRKPEGKKGGLFSGKEKGDKESKIPFAGLIAKLPFGKKKSGDEKKDKKSADKVKEKSSGLFAGAGALFSSLKPGKGKSRDEKTKEIDELLDQTINDVIPSSPEVKEEKSREEISEDDSDSAEPEDDFSDFDSLDLGIEEDSDEPIESSAGSILQAEEEIPESTIAEILAKEGIDLDLELEDDEFSEISEVKGESESSDDSSDALCGAEDLPELDEDISGLELESSDDFDELDDFDLDEIEIDEDEDFEPEEEIDVELGDESVAEVSGPPDVPEEEEDIFAAPPKEWEQGSFGLMSDDSDGEESFTASFESGGDEGDLFAMLKSDTQKAVNIQETSLVRDMKDVRVSSEELIEGLETLMFSLGGEIEKTNRLGNKEDNEELSAVLNQGSEEE